MFRGCEASELAAEPGGDSAAESDERTSLSPGLADSGVLPRPQSLQLTDEHFRRAVAGSSALQNPVPSLRETTGNDSQAVYTAQSKTPKSSRAFGTLCRDAVNKNYPART